MMKINALLLTLSIAACGGGGPKPVENPDQPVENPAAGGAVECEKEIALQCATGQTDGCLAGVTAFHVCVDEGTAAGPPCEQEIAKVCPDGQVDGCLQTPQWSPTHVCVVAPAPAGAEAPAP
jgi:hypothetical protein